jgi:hypothetical protein
MKPRSILREQALALLGLRWAVWRRRLTQDGKWGRLGVGLLGLFGFLIVSGVGVAFVVIMGMTLAKDPQELARFGGGTALMGLLLTAMLGARLYFSIISVVSGQPFLHPRRFLVYAVPPGLITAINCVAQLFEAGWAVFYPAALTAAYVFSQVPSGPPIWASVLALLLLFLCAASVLQMVSAVVTEVFASKTARRVLILLVMSSIWGVALSISRISFARRALSPESLWSLAKRLPSGWAAQLADALGRGELLAALGFALLLIGTALASAWLGHRLVLRDARRPAETILVSKAVSQGPAGWRIPLLSNPISALFEKEVKTIFRAMWLQMVAGPIGFLVMRFLLMQGGKSGGPLVGPQPLLMGAFYAHLGVLAWSVNMFGVDGQATRGIFLWPLRGRTVVAAKNAVAYAISLLTFLTLALLSMLVAPVTAQQVVIGLCAHAATFPVLATLGNVTSIYFPSPMKSGKSIRQPGGSTAIARVGALGLIALTGWAPYALAKLVGIPLIAAYLGELLAMAIAYGGLLSFAEHLLEARREPLLAALSKEE